MLNIHFLLGHSFGELDILQRLAQYLSVFSPNAEHYGPEKTPYLDTFRTQCD